MFSTPAMVDLKRTPEEMNQAIMPGISEYDYGLCLSLGDDSLKKLDVDFDSVEVGETYHLFILAKVTAKSRNDNEGGMRDRVELQITHMGAESEDKENEESEKKPLRKKMYNE